MSALIEEITVLKAQKASFESERTFLQSLFNIPRSEWSQRYKNQFPTDEALQQEYALLRQLEKLTHFSTK